MGWQGLSDQDIWAHTRLPKKLDGAQCRWMGSAKGRRITQCWWMWLKLATRFNNSLLGLRGCGGVMWRAAWSELWCLFQQIFSWLIKMNWAAVGLLQHQCVRYRDDFNLFYWKFKSDPDVQTVEAYFKVLESVQFFYLHTLKCTNNQISMHIDSSLFLCYFR